MSTLKIESLWYQGEYGTFKIKGKHKPEDVLVMLTHGSELLEYIG